MKGPEEPRRENEALRKHISRLSTAGLLGGASLDLSKAPGEAVNNACTLDRERYDVITNIADSGQAREFTHSGLNPEENRQAVSCSIERGSSSISVTRTFGAAKEPHTAVKNRIFHRKYGSSRRFAAFSRIGGELRAVMLVLCGAVLTVAAGAQTSTDWRIDTFVGQPGIEGRLSFPRGIVVDSAGNLFIADRGNHRIRKVDSAGVISTVAGTGERGYGGNGGPAADAQLNSPTGVAVDGAGNLFIADYANNRVRKVDSAGGITAFAGTGEIGDGGDGGPAAEAQLSYPYGLAVDGASNLYIAEEQGHRIRKVDSAGVISTFAGTGEYGFGGDGGPAAEARLSYPRGVAADGAGNLYIADYVNYRIRKVGPTGIITTFAGTGEYGFEGAGGPASAARLAAPIDVATDGAGNLYIADSNNRRIRKVDSSFALFGAIIDTIAGTGEFGFSGDGESALDAQLSLPWGVAVDDAGNLYIADYHNHRIRKVDATGLINTIAGTGEIGDGAAASDAQLRGPPGVAVDGEGNTYIADSANHRIRQVDSAGVISTIAGTGEYGYSGDGGRKLDAQLSLPSSVAVDSAGNLYIADTNNHRVRKVRTTLALFGVPISTVAGTGESGFGGDGGRAVDARLSNPWGIALDGMGNLYIADTNNHRIRKVDATGVISTIAGTGESGFSGDGGRAVDARLSYPWSVAGDSMGNLYIADANNHRIRKVDSAGVISTFAGTGESGFSGDGGLAADARLNNPRGVTVDGGGNLFIADRLNHRIRKVGSAGVISTFAGTGESGFSGDGGAAVDARLSLPSSVALDAIGRLFIGDSGNNRIRIVTPPSA